MTLQIKHSNILDEDYGILVHGVNAQGVMNSGIAKQIRNKYPIVYSDYVFRYKDCGNKLDLGDAIITDVKPNYKIVSGVTQQFYGRDKTRVYADYKAIAKVFLRVNELALSTDLPVLFPLIGCGLGNGDKEKVLWIIDNVLSSDVKRTLFLFDTETCFTR